MTRPGLTLVIALMAASVSGPALADPPPRGAEKIIFNLPVILCDTEAEVQDIFNASKVDLAEGLKTAFAKWYEVMNSANQHTCQMMQVAFLHVYESVKLGVVDSSGNAMPAWAVHAGNDTTDAWALYFEPHAVNEWRVP